MDANTQSGFILNICAILSLPGGRVELESLGGGRDTGPPGLPRARRWVESGARAARRPAAVRPRCRDARGPARGAAG